MLDLRSREIIAGGDMAMPRHQLHLATIRRGREERVFALGGWNGSTQLNTVEEWLEENSTWKAAEKLAGKKSLFGAVSIPALSCID